jgi:CheY-like chemotaxis protein
MDEPTARVLVVEDEEVAREAICSLLEIEGYQTAQVQNGKEALDYLHSNPPPFLILLDLLMPVMDGWKFMAEQNRDERLAQVPILIMTAASAQKRIGPHHVLHKPLDATRLLTMVAQYRAESSTRQS